MEQSEKTNNGILRAIEILTTVLGIWAIVTNKLGTEQPLEIWERFTLSLTLIVVIVIVDKVLKTGKLILDILGYIILIALVGYFLIMLWRSIKPEPRNEFAIVGGIEWQPTNATDSIKTSVFNNLPDSLKYGRYYTFEEAKLACASIPGGWRLPSQTEFEQLISECGPDPQSAFYSISDGNCVVKLPLAGICENKITNVFPLLTQSGFYWTGDLNPKNTKEAIAFVLNGRLGKKYTNFDELEIKVPHHRFPCRCVRRKLN